jgi:hypothetical protein
MFTSVIRQIESVFIKSSTNDRKDLPLTTLPTTVAKLRRVHTDGTYSMNVNLPKPSTKMLENHCYVHIADCILDFLGHGKHSLLDFRCNPLLSSPVQNDIFKSQYGLSMVEQMTKRHSKFPTSDSFPLIVVLVVLWSDDFEPNKSIKSNRGSVWIKTATFIVKGQTGTSHTYISYRPGTSQNRP